MPGNRCIECLKDRGDVAIGEVVVRLTDDGSVGRDHGCSMVYNAESCLSGESISRASSSIPAMSPEPISVGWTLYVRLKDGPGKESLIGGGNSFLRRHFAPNSRI